MADFSFLDESPVTVSDDNPLAFLDDAVAPRAVKKSTTRSVVAVKHTPSPALGCVIGVHLVWLVVVLFAAPVAIGAGSAGNFQSSEKTGRESICYIGQNSAPRIKTILTLGWAFSMGLYGYLWYRDVKRARTDQPSPFSPGQRSVQSGIIAGCRAVVIVCAALQLATYTTVVDMRPQGFGPGYVDLDYATYDWAILQAAFFAGLCVAVVAGLVRYSTINTR